MSRPRWTIRRNRLGRWTVSQVGTVTMHSFSSWPLAILYVNAQVSKYCVAEVIRRAEESGEMEVIEAHRIDTPVMHRKRRRIVQAAWWRRLSVSVAIEEEADPRDSLLLVKVSPERAS